jgi:hypothetical protein
MAANLYRRFLLGLILLIALFPDKAFSEVSREYKIKAAFLFNFTKYVEWPAESFKSDSAPFTIGILGVDPFGNALDLLADQNVRGRKIILKKVRRVDEAGGCQLLFVCSSEKGQWRTIITELKGRNILTISDIDQFAGGGGMIGLVQVEDKIQFEVNLDAAQQAKLKISSQLLKLAKIVSNSKAD